MREGDTAVGDMAVDMAVGTADSTEDIVEDSMAGQVVAPVFNLSEGIASAGLLLPSDGTA
jgi:hypothetical protein